MFESNYHIIYIVLEVAQSTVPKVDPYRIIVASERARYRNVFVKWLIGNKCCALLHGCWISLHECKNKS